MVGRWRPGRCACARLLGRLDQLQQQRLLVEAWHAGRVARARACARLSLGVGIFSLGDRTTAVGGGLLPPLHRPWQLGWRELWAAALNPQLRQAEHLQAA